MDMSAAALRGICQQHEDLYVTPALNDRLYCNFAGFGRLGGLEEYTDVRTLFLEGNALQDLGGLPTLPLLTCLYVQGNQLERLAGLGGAPALQTLNASSNRLRSLAGVEACGATLRTLLAAGNCLEDGAAALDPLLACTALESLDLSANRLPDPAPLLALLRRLPALRCLYLRGNPLVSALQQYRKAIIAAAPGLTYLDDRPVTEKERRCAAAWAGGGAEAERAERDVIAVEERAVERGRMEALAAIRRQGIAKRREALGLPPGDTGPCLEGHGDAAEFDAASEDGGVASASNSGSPPAEGSSLGGKDPPELQAALQRLEALSCETGLLDGSRGLTEEEFVVLMDEGAAARAAHEACALPGVCCPCPGENGGLES